MKITLQVPISDYGTLATLAAMAKMPIDKYVVAHTLNKTEK
jgi:hypothetical protein